MPSTIRLSLGFVDAYHNLCLDYADQGWFDEAIEEYKTALKLKLGFAGVYIILGRLEEAINANLVALRLRPDNEEAHYNLCSFVL